MLSQLLDNVIERRVKNIIGEIMHLNRLCFVLFYVT